MSRAARLRFAIAGAPGAGKSEVLSEIHATLLPVRRDDIFVRAMGADQIAGFDFSPPCLVPTSDIVASARMATVVGPVADAAVWNHVLADLDALLFVVDDRRMHLAQNVAALLAFGAIRALRDVPCVFYFRATGLPDSLSRAALMAEFNPADAPVATHADAALRELCGAALAAS